MDRVIFDLLDDAFAVIEPDNGTQKSMAEALILTERI